MGDGDSTMSLALLDRGCWIESRTAVKISFQKIPYKYTQRYCTGLRCQCPMPVPATILTPHFSLFEFQKA